MTHCWTSFARAIARLLNGKFSLHHEFLICGLEMPIDYEVDRKVRSRNKLCTYKAIMQRSPFSFILIFRFIANSSVDGWMENLFVSPTHTQNTQILARASWSFFFVATHTRRLAERSRRVDTQSARLSSKWKKSEFQPLQLAITCEIGQHKSASDWWS